MSSKPLNHATASTVLVVEDEDSIRMLVQYSLESRGYKVLTACDGLEALTVAKEYKGVIDLLITDFTMPGITGAELVDQILSLRPYIKILLISGNSDTVSIRNGCPSINVLFKPFSPSQLLDKVGSLHLECKNQESR